MANKLVMIVSAIVGLFIFFIPVVIIAMILASIGGLDDKEQDPCFVPGEAGKTMVRFTYPVPDHREIAREYAPGDDEDDPPDHAGVDFNTGSSKDVFASAEGNVIEANRDDLVVKVQHADGFQSWYMSLATVSVNNGDKVDPSKKIGTTGTSMPEFGAPGAHLHFEIHGDASSLDKPGKAIDPKSTIEQGQEAVDAGCTCDGLTGKDNREKVFNFFVGKGLTAIQAAGIMGNLSIESGYEPKKQQGGAIVSSKEAEDNPQGSAWGLAQWDPPGKVIRPAVADGHAYEEIDSLEFQLNMIWKGMSGDPKGYYVVPSTLPAVKAATTTEQAVLAFQEEYERPGVPHTAGRVDEADKVVNDYGGSNPGGGGGDEEGGGGGCTGEIINIDGHDYSFPFIRPKNDVSFPYPCKVNGSPLCHHDGTAAFDVARKAWDGSTEGVVVTAIVSGKIERFNPAYDGINGCHSFQLVGDDGWHYWYGHLKETSVQSGQVKVGQPLAKVGPTECAKGSPPHLHIDRGSPKGHYGGSDCCRDSGFIDLFGRLFQALPD